MFGTGLRNPLYRLFETSDYFMYILASIAIIMMLVLLWQRHNRYAGWSAIAAVGMFIMGVEMTIVQSIEPLDITVRGNFGDLDDYDTTLQATPDYLTLPLSLAFIGAICVLIHRAAKARKILTLGALIVGYFAVSTYTIDLCEALFATGPSEMRDGFWAASSVGWSLVFVSLCAYLGLAAVVGVVRGVRRIRNRAEINVANSFAGSATTTPSAR